MRDGRLRGLVSLLFFIGMVSSTSSTSPTSTIISEEHSLPSTDPEHLHQQKWEGSEEEEVDDEDYHGAGLGLEWNHLVCRTKGQGKLNPARLLLKHVSGKAKPGR